MQIPRIYSLGLSDLSKFVLHSLGQNKLQPAVPEVVLLLKSEAQLSKFVTNESKLTVTDYSGMRPSSHTLQFMASHEPPKFADGSFAHIQNLVISASTLQLKTQLRKYRKVISQDTNILLMNENLSALQQIQKLWPIPIHRPNIYQCISSHTVWKGRDEFSVNRIGRGNLTISKVPRSYKDADDDAYLESPELHIEDSIPLIQLLNDTDSINPVFVNYNNFQLLQMESLILKSCLEPLSTVFDCSNGDLLKMENLSDIARGLIAESVKILTKAYPNLMQSSLASVALDQERLLHVFFKILYNNRKDGKKLSLFNKKIKLQEIFETNGYLVGLGRAHGVSAHLNLTYSNLLKAKYSLAENDQLHGW